MVLWPFPVEQGGAEGQVAVAGGGGEEGFAFAQGDEQQVGGAGLVPEHPFAVVPGGVVGQHAEGRFDLGAAVVAVHAQRHRQGPRQWVETAIGPLAQQPQQLDQLLAPGACLSEHRQGLIERPPLAAGAEIRLQPCRC